MEAPSDSSSISQDSSSISQDSAIEEVCGQQSGFYSALQSPAEWWRKIKGSNFMVRGVTYLKDKVKVKAEEPLLKLLKIDFYKSDTNLTEVPLDSKSMEGGKENTSFLILNFKMSGNPSFYLILYYYSLPSAMMNESDEFWSSKFKIITSLVEGPFILRAAMGSKICLPKKACTIMRGSNYLKIDIDLMSTPLANGGAFKLVKKYMHKSVIDIGFVIEGKAENELPERLLGTVQFRKINMENFVEI